MADEVTVEPPTSGWLKRVPFLPYKECLELLQSLGELPPKRPDLYLPDNDDVLRTLAVVGKHVALKQSKAPYLNLDELSSIIGYTLEDPYPWYKLLSAWMMSNRRDDRV
eukprot:PhF_6_TR25536/c1_g1_i6/m.35808